MPLDPKHLLLNAFDMNCVGHLQHGLWRHPRDEATRYLDLSYWIELARTLERGKFDALFLADIVGVYDIYGGSAAAAIAGAVQIPVNDPLLVVPAMAAVTHHLGFGVTCNLTYEPPFLFARRMSTLDHLTGGRIGWNIVTGYLDSAARAMGLPQQPNHDDRYDMADEYLELVYKLWEGSWEDDAVLVDRAAGRYADPARVRAIDHHGRYFQADGIHLCEPSPQRTPVLFQAGTSTRGRQFAAAHAECVFVNSQPKPLVRSLVDDLRRRAANAGRARHDLKVFVGVSVIPGATDADALARLAEYRAYASTEGGLAHFSASVGIDFSSFGPDEPIRQADTQANQSNLEAITTRSTQPAWTVRKLQQQMVLGSRNVPIVGSAATIADELQSWMDEADVDGFNLSRVVAPESFVDFVDMVVPELQGRGVYKQDYAAAPTLRGKLFGHARLPASHPAAGARAAR